MAESIDAVFTITRREYVRAMRTYYKRKLNVVRDSVVGLAMIGLGCYFLQATGNSLLGWFAIASGVIVIGLNLYAVTVLPELIYRYQPKLKSEYRMQFRDTGIHFQTDDIDAELKWSLYHSWLRDEEFYILYSGKRDVSVIPRRALGDADERFSAMLQKHIGTAVN
jgi:hypothetical protein